MIYCYYGCNWYSWTWWLEEAKSEVSDGSLLLLVAFLLVNAPNCHLSLVLASVVQGDADTCNRRNMLHSVIRKSLFFTFHIYKQTKLTEKKNSTNNRKAVSIVYRRKKDPWRNEVCFWETIKYGKQLHAHCPRWNCSFLLFFISVSFATSVVFDILKSVSWLVPVLSDVEKCFCPRGIVTNALDRNHSFQIFLHFVYIMFYFNWEDFTRDFCGR